MPRFPLRFLSGVFIVMHFSVVGTVAGSLRADSPDSTYSIRLSFADSAATHGQFLRFHQLRRPRVALVLSGGGARGVAQIGVLKVLEKYGIPVDFIASTSVGAILGGLYAAGYTTAELEHMVLTTNWDDLLSLLEEPDRSELFMDQKIIGERSFVAIRFQGFEPVIPPAVSSGQRFTDFLNTEVLQAPYHAFPDFDHLKIPFRAVSTDLVSGRKVVLRDGSLAEALRASGTVPLLFSPIEKDGMKLVDGGLVDNIPVDIAQREGYDIVIAVNSTSGLRREDEMSAPWQTADQIVGIMMERLKPEQLQAADVVITPEIGRHLSSDFHGLDTLIASGVQSAEEKIPEILSLFRKKAAALESQDSSNTFTDADVEFTGVDSSLPEWLEAREAARNGSLTREEIRRHLRAIFSRGIYDDVYATVTVDSPATHIRYVGVPLPVVSSVRIEGARRLPQPALEWVFATLTGQPMNYAASEAGIDSVLRLYRAEGYSLARIDSAGFDRTSGTLFLRVNEGVVNGLEVEGGVRTQDEFVLNEFPIQRGEIFQIDRARRGLTNITSTGLFEYVYLEVNYSGSQSFLTIRLRERPSQLLRLGLRVDDERNLQGLIDVRDENFHGIGTELGMTIAGGQRNLDAILGYKSRRVLGSYITFGASTFYRTLNSYVYTDAPDQPENHWDRQKVGEYRDIRYGGSVFFGAQLERLGDATAEFILQNIRITNLDQADALQEREQLSIIRFGSVIDTKDRYPFANSGEGLNLSYEFAFQGFGSDVSYTALSMMYERFTSWGARLTFHPRVTLGFADKTMPLSQQFRLGGRDSFFGLREDDQRGRQLLLLNLEIRYLLPIRLVFDTYLRARYDLGTISANPEEIKFSSLRHGIGAELAFRTPLGAAAFGAGESFFFGKDLPQNPIQQGPLLFYFKIGYEF